MFLKRREIELRKRSILVRRAVHFQDHDIAVAGAKEQVCRGRRALVLELLAKKMPALIVTFKIGINVADFALAVDCVMAGRREREGDLAVEDRGMNIAADIGDVHASAVVIDNQFRGAGRLDAVADPNFAALAESMRAVPGNIRRGN